MKKRNTNQSPKRQIVGVEDRITIGLDLGDKKSRYCLLNGNGGGVEASSVETTKQQMVEKFGRMRRCRIAMEVGTHSPWLSRLLTSIGHEVIVANARQVHLISASSRKDDRVDAETLARLARVDPKLLRPIRHRSEEELGISKEGDVYLRKLLVQGAQCILSRRGEDSDVKRWGLKLAGHGGKNAKKRAIVAVARNLAILLHRLWVTGEVYEPLRNSSSATASHAAA